jgi:hypothetical protein
MPVRASETAELGREVTVDFEADANLDEGRGGPGHDRYLTLVALLHFLMSAGGTPRTELRSAAHENDNATSCRKPERVPPRCGALPCGWPLRHFGCAAAALSYRVLRKL